MSLVFLTHHNENIYNLDIAKQFREKIIRPDKYISIYKKKILSERVLDVRQKGDDIHKKILETHPKYSAHKTMGYAETSCPDPCNFLRKNHGIKFERTPLHKCGESSRGLEPVPRRAEMKRTTIRPPLKNFKRINVLKTFVPPKRPLPKVATTINGRTVLLCNAGIMPTYLFSPNFGKTPKYIREIKQCLADQCSGKSTKIERKLELPPGITMVSDEVRKDIVVGLKKKWVQIMNKYQAAPVYADTIPKKIRQRKTENRLRQLEQDILLIENNPVIYVCDKN